MVQTPAQALVVVRTLVKRRPAAGTTVMTERVRILVTGAEADREPILVKAALAISAKERMRISATSQAARMFVIHLVIITNAMVLGQMLT